MVASILIAFALDAWWDDRQLEKEMAEDLAIVEYELSENLRLVSLSMDSMEQVVKASNQLVDIFHAHSEEPSVEIEGSILFWSIFASPTLDPSFGGIDSWISAGRLAGIESIELRQRLASVRGKVSDVTEEQFDAKEMLTREIHPLIRNEIGDIAAIKNLWVAGFGTTYSGMNQDIPDVGTISVPNTNALRFHLQTRTLWLQVALREMADFREELEAIQSLLREEMGN